jgi:hypothetical protein
MLTDYFGAKASQCTPAQYAAAITMLDKVNDLLDHAAAEQDCDYLRVIDVDTGSCISGVKGGAGDGGFRLATSTTGDASSKHRTAHAVDVFDPGNKLDDWITDEILARFGLWRERPEITPGWCHLQDVVTLTGKRSS